MKPAAFAYARPDDLEDCLAILRERGEDAVVLAGGQSLLPLLNMRLSRPTLVVDVNALSGLDTIEVTAAGVRVGALTRAARAERDPHIARAAPALAAALAYVGHPQTRTRTTLGGNVAHADPASELPAVLAALDGTVELASATSTRIVAWHEYFLGPYWTSRRPDELVIGVSFGAPAGFRWTFVELARRHGDFAIAGACVGLHIEGDEVVGARVALCGVESVPVRRSGAEAALCGPLPLHPRLADVEASVREGLDPFGDVHAPSGYRRAMAGLLVRRAAESVERDGRATAATCQQGGS